MYEKGPSVITIGRKILHVFIIEFKLRCGLHLNHKSLRKVQNPINVIGLKTLVCKTCCVYKFVFLNTDDSFQGKPHKIFIQHGLLFIQMQKTAVFPRYGPNSNNL